MFAVAGESMGLPAAVVQLFSSGVMVSHITSEGCAWRSANPPSNGSYNGVLMFPDCRISSGEHLRCRVLDVRPQPGHL